MAHDPLDAADVALILNTVIEGPDQYDGLGEALPIGGDPADYNITVAMALRALVAYCANNGVNLDTNNGIATLKSVVGGRNRLVANLVNGNRTITSRNLT